MILMHVQDIVKEAPTDVLRPDVAAIPCEFIDNYENEEPLASPPASRLISRASAPEFGVLPGKAAQADLRCPSGARAGLSERMAQCRCKLCGIWRRRLRRR